VSCGVIGAELLVAVAGALLWGVAARTQVLSVPADSGGWDRDLGMPEALDGALRAQETLRGGRSTLWSLIVGSVDPITFAPTVLDGFGPGRHAPWSPSGRDVILKPLLGRRPGRLALSGLKNGAGAANPPGRGATSGGIHAAPLDVNEAGAPPRALGTPRA